MGRQSLASPHQQCDATANVQAILAWGKQLPSFYCCVLWSHCMSSPGCVPSQPLGHLHPSHGCRVRNREGLDTAQQYSVHWFVFHTVLVMNPKHSTVQAAMKEIDSIPTKPSTASLWAMGRKS